MVINEKPLPLLPALLQASLLSLLSSAIPLETVYATVSKGLPSSYHVFAFDGTAKLLVAESEGDFGIDEWGAVCAEAEKECAEEIEGLRKGWKR